MRNLLRWMGYGFVVALFLGNSVTQKANVILVIMLLCVAVAALNWLARKTADLDISSDRTEERPKNVVPLRRVR